MHEDNRIVRLDKRIDKQTQAFIFTTRDEHNPQDCT
jgi:hypothetical protein